MTDPNVPPVDPNEPVDPVPVEPVDEEDEDLNPEVDPVPPDNETPEQLRTRLAASEEARRNLFARLQREKNKNKGTPPPAQTPATPSQPVQPTSLTREEGILFSKGFSEDEVEYAKKVATLEGVKLTDAINNKLFTGWKAERDAETRRQEAQLPASRGGRVAKKTTFDTKDLSDDEHKALFDEMEK